MKLLLVLSHGCMAVREVMGTQDPASHAFSSTYPIPVCCSSMPSCLDAWGRMSTSGMGRGCRKAFLLPLSMALIFFSPICWSVHFPVVGNHLSSLCADLSPPHHSSISFQLTWPTSDLLFEILSSKTGGERQGG